MSDAHEAIRNLLGTYCELMDDGAWADVVRCSPTRSWLAPTALSSPAAPKRCRRSTNQASTAEAIAYLASDAARMITGTSLVVDGGTHS